MPALPSQNLSCEEGKITICGGGFLVVSSALPFMVIVAGAPVAHWPVNVRGSIFLPSPFLSILTYFSIIFCGRTQNKRLVSGKPVRISGFLPLAALGSCRAFIFTVRKKPCVSGVGLENRPKALSPLGPAPSQTGTVSAGMSTSTVSTCSGPFPPPKSKGIFRCRQPGPRLISLRTKWPLSKRT